MKRLDDYRPLIRDRRHLATTLARQVLGPVLTDGLDYRPGEAHATLRNFHPDTLRCRVQAIAVETPTTRRFRLAPLDGPFPPFFAGQYVNVFCEVDGVRTSRPYSIASSPSHLGAIDLLVKAKEGGFVSNHLVEHVRVGEELTLSGPAGDFYYTPLRDTDDLVFIAGGSGIAPFLGMLDDLRERAAPVRVTLLYGSRRADDIIAQAHLDRLVAGVTGLTVVHVVSEPDAAPDTRWTGERGFLDRALLSRHLHADRCAGQTYFLCGPPAMYTLVQAALAELGVPAHRIRTEAFGPPADVTTSPGWPREVPADATFQVTEERTGTTLTAPAREPLMNSLERAGLALPALCRSGVCATCRTRLVSGSVYSPDDAALRDSDILAGYIHPCLAYPTSDLVLRLP